MARMSRGRSVSLATQRKSREADARRGEAPVNVGAFGKRKLASWNAVEPGICEICRRPYPIHTKIYRWGTHRVHRRCVTTLL